MRRSRVALFTVGVLAAGAIAVAAAPSGNADAIDLVKIPGLHAPASVIRDDDGIAHIKAQNTHDLFFLQGWVHSDDRLFQMDARRRQGSGTLAELIGSSALPSDVQLRTFGLRRTVERSLSVLSSETQADLAAYADGVNAWIARNPLPSQYAAVQVTKVAPWTVTDSLLVNKLLTFSLSFDLDIDRTTAVQRYNAAGLDGHTAVFQDVFPFAPFNTASPVIDSTATPANPGTRNPVSSGNIGVSDEAERLAADYLKKAEQVPLIVEAMNRSAERGSNSWVIGGQHTATGKPILASDPHLTLESPSTLQPIDLQGGGFNAQGDSLPGTPYLILGQNRDITYGATLHFVDVTDTYTEKIQPDPASPSGLSTMYQGKLEPVVAIPEKYRVNPRTPGQQDVLNDVPAGGAIPAQTLIVPRRNNGPLVAVNLAAGTGLSVQYTGWSPTTELETFRRFGLARNVDDFQDAMQYFDIGGQHFTYADTKGNIAYFTNAEIPVREDLQAGMVKGNPPYLLRDGTGGNEWLPVTNPQPNQSLPYEIVPFAELPKVINPPAGFIVSANNDPTANSFDNNVLNQVRSGRRHRLPRLHPRRRVPGRPDHRHGEGRRRQGSDHHRRRGEDAGRRDIAGCSVLRSGHHGHAGPGQAQLHTGAGGAGEGSAHRRGGRSARQVELHLPDRHPGGVRRQRRRRQAQQAIAAGDRQQRGGHDLRAVARPVRRQRDRPARPADLADAAGVRLTYSY